MILLSFISLTHLLKSLNTFITLNKQLCFRSVTNKRNNIFILPSFIPSLMLFSFKYRSKFLRGFFSDLTLRNGCVSREKAHVMIMGTTMTEATEVSFSLKIIISMCLLLNGSSNCCSRKVDHSCCIFLDLPVLQILLAVFPKTSVVW